MSSSSRYCSILLVFAALLPGASQAACTRPIIAPLSPSGMTLRMEGDKVSGFLPELLRRFGKEVGCEFVFTIAPRARIEAQFEAGQADVVMASTRSDRRDKLGVFVSMVSTRATVLSLGKPTAPIKSLADLIARQDVRVALVRGQEYGGGFPDMVKALTAQNRIIYESNSNNVARLIDAGIADVTVMTPIALAGQLGTDPRYAHLIARLRIDPVEELPWGETGAYISRTTVGPEDLAALEQMFANIGKSSTLMENMRATYPPNILRESVR